MQAQKDFPAALPKDKLLVQSMIAPVGLNAEHITSEMFKKDKGNDVEELNLRVVFVTADPPSPIAKVSEEDCSPEAPKVDNPDQRNYVLDLFDAATTSTSEFPDQPFKVSSRNKMDKEQIFEVGLNSDIVGTTEKVEDNVKDEGIRRTSTESKEHEQNGEDEWGLGRRSAERNNQLIDKVKEESSVKEVQVDTKIRKKRSKKDKKNLEADDSRLEFESKIKMLEEELREAVALEIGLYSIVAEHLNSKRKVHAPARRLSRFYRHFAKLNHKLTEQIELLVIKHDNTKSDGEPDNGGNSAPD
ncbi:Vesicle-associated protein 1-1 [Bienertia sinuspersici]